jgi:hypothetical protein
VGAPALDGSARRTQSVLDLLEVDVGFTLRGLAEGDDADFIFGLRVNYRNWDAGQKAKRLEPLPLFTVVEPIIFKGLGRAFKDSRGIGASMKSRPCSLKLIVRLRSDPVNRMSRV